VFRLGGLVAQGSIRKGEGVHFYFDITDGANTVAVKYIGTDLPPDLFEEGQGTIATGRFSDGLFEATEILAKHDETYMPKEVIDAFKEQGVYQGCAKAPDPKLAGGALGTGVVTICTGKSERSFLPSAFEPLYRTYA
jgi:cytochrome c-type biogenesis protein CcmE